MTISTIGDQARFFAQSLATNRLKQSLQTLTQELSSGEVADIGTRLQGNTRLLGAIEARIGALQQFQRNASDAAILLDGVQHALGGAREVASSLGVELATELFAHDAVSLRNRSDRAATALNQVVERLNFAVGGRFVLSGLASDVPPLVSGPEIVAMLSTVTAGLTGADDVRQAVSAWFDAPPGGGGFLDHAYQGTVGEPQIIPVSGDSAVAIRSSAASPELRDLLKALSLAALPAQGVLAGSPAEQRALILGAGSAMIDADRNILAEIARVGISQQSVEQAQGANASALTILGTRRNDMRSADPFETAAALSEVQSQIEAMYAVTARLSKLKLVNFLR